MHTAQKTTIHHPTTMLSTSENVLLPGHNHLLTTGADDPSLSVSPEHQVKVDSGFFAQWQFSFRFC